MVLKSQREYREVRQRTYGNIAGFQLVVILVQTVAVSSCFCRRDTSSFLPIDLLQIEERTSEMVIVSRHDDMFIAHPIIDEDSV